MSAMALFRPRRAALASPLAPNPSHLEQFVWADILSGSNPAAVPLSRAGAMSVPAVAAARHLIAGAIAACPLESDAATQPAWLKDAGELPAWHRMAWTIDDLLFSGWALWLIDRDTTGAPVRASRVPLEAWRFTNTGGVERQITDTVWAAVPAESAVLIPGPHEGILTIGADAIRAAQALATTARERSEHPEALVELHYTGELTLTPEEIKELLNSYLKARAATGGRAVSFTPKNVEMRVHAADANALIIDGRNAAALDIARVIGIPASMIDATVNTASLTYATAEGNNAQFIDYGLRKYMDAVTAALSMNTLTAVGETITFDTRPLRNPAPTAPPIGD